VAGRDDPQFEQIVFERCLSYLDAAVVLLSQPPTAKLSQQGWTEEKLEELRSLVCAWRRDFEDDGRITPRQHRVMIRWFLDADLDFEAVALLLASTDNTVYQFLHPSIRASSPGEPDR
jgi:hypothetical protein